LKFSGGGGVKEMYEACLECPEGLGVLEKIPSAGEVFIFSGTTNYTINYWHSP